MKAARIPRTPAPVMVERGYITLHGAAAILGCSTATVRRQGVPGAVLYGGVLYLPRHAVEALLPPPALAYTPPPAEV